MSKVITTTVLPKDGFDIINIGAAGDTVAIGGDSLNTNVLQDAGGNNIFTSSSGTVSSTILGGGVKLLSTQNASASANISFTTGIDSTYDVYVFKYINMNPATDIVNFTFQAGSGYNTTMTSTYFAGYQNESGSGSGLVQPAGYGQANGTSFQALVDQLGNLAKESCSGELVIFKPSSTTYVKHFLGRTQGYNGAPPGFATDIHIGGYLNTTTAITQVQFKMSSGNIAAGTIKLYGISKS